MCTHSPASFPSSFWDVSTETFFDRVREWTNAPHLFALIGGNYGAAAMLAAHNLAPVPFIASSPRGTASGQAPKRAESVVDPVVSVLLVYAPCCGRVARIPSEARLDLLGWAPDTPHFRETTCKTIAALEAVHHQGVDGKACAWAIEAKRWMLGSACLVDFSQSFVVHARCQAVRVSPSQTSAAPFILPHSSSPQCMRHTYRVLANSFVFDLLNSFSTSAVENVIEFNGAPPAKNTPIEVEQHQQQQHAVLKLIADTGASLRRHLEFGNAISKSDHSDLAISVSWLISLIGFDLGQPHSDQSTKINGNESHLFNGSNEKRGIVNSFLTLSPSENFQSGAGGSGVVNISDCLGVHLTSDHELIVKEMDENSRMHRISVLGAIDALETAAQQDEGTPGEKRRDLHFGMRAPFRCQFCGAAPIISVETRKQEKERDAAHSQGSEARENRWGLAGESAAAAGSSKKEALTTTFTLSFYGGKGHFSGCPWKRFFLDSVLDRSPKQSASTSTLRVRLGAPSTDMYDDLRSTAQPKAAERDPNDDVVIDTQIALRFSVEEVKMLLAVLQRSVAHERSASSSRVGAVNPVVSTISASFPRPLYERTEELVAAFAERKRKRDEELTTADGGLTQSCPAVITRVRPPHVPLDLAWSLSASRCEEGMGVESMLWATQAKRGSASSNKAYGGIEETERWRRAYELLRRNITRAGTVQPSGDSQHIEKAELQEAMSAYQHAKQLTNASTSSQPSSMKAVSSFSLLKDSLERARSVSSSTRINSESSSPSSPVVDAYVKSVTTALRKMSAPPEVKPAPSTRVPPQQQHLPSKPQTGQASASTTTANPSGATSATIRNPTVMNQSNNNSSNNNNNSNSSGGSHVNNFTRETRPTQSASSFSPSALSIRQARFQSQNGPQSNNPASPPQQQQQYQHYHPREGGGYGGNFGAGGGSRRGRSRSNRAGRGGGGGPRFNNSRGGGGGGY